MVTLPLSVPPVWFWLVKRQCADKAFKDALYSN
jgi:hypothetical protein